MVYKMSSSGSSAGMDTSATGHAMARQQPLIKL